MEFAGVITLRVTEETQCALERAIGRRKRIRSLAKTSLAISMETRWADM